MTTANMNKYKDMSNRELLILYDDKLQTLHKAETAYMCLKMIAEAEIIFDEILSRMIPRESVKLTVK